MKKNASITIAIALSATLLAFSGCTSMNKCQDNDTVAQTQEELSAKPDTDVDLYSEALALNQKTTTSAKTEVKKTLTPKKSTQKVTKNNSKHKKTKKTPAKKAKTKTT